MSQLTYETLRTTKDKLKKERGAMRSATEAGEGVPAFLAKLWKLVDDLRTNHLISWAQGGSNFVIKNQIDFARKLLPLYYKHNNMASFIRQLNMYGFHKVVSVDNGSLKCENEEIQFSHPCFLKGHAYLLKHIKRKIANPKSTTNDEKALLKPEMMTRVLTDVKQMKGRQESLDARFSIMKHENEALWREVALLRQKHLKQQQIVNNLIQFIMSIVQNSRNGPLKTGIKRRYQLMINNAAHNSEDDMEFRGSKSPRVDSDLEMDDDNDFILPEMENLNDDDDDGPIIHELRDGSEHSASFSLLSPDRDLAVQSPAVEAASPATSLMPDVFDDAPAEDDEEAEIHNSALETFEETPNTSTTTLGNNKNKNKKSSKALKKADTKKVSTPTENDFSINSAQTSTALPTDIFESDEAISQDGSGVSMSEVDTQAALSALKSGGVFLNSPSGSVDDDYINSVIYGNYNSKINLMPASKGKKSKNGKQKPTVQSIKQELPGYEEEANTDNMAVALSHDSRPVLARFNSVAKGQIPWSCQPTIKVTTNLSSADLRTPWPLIEDVDDHLTTMQNDIECLRDLLSRDNCTLDANALLGLFGTDEPFYGLSINPMDISLDKSKEPVDDAGNQIISYVPPTSNIDFQDLEFGEELTSESLDDVVSSSIDESGLNTPQVQLPEPKFLSKD